MDLSQSPGLCAKANLCNKWWNYDDPTLVGILKNLDGNSSETLLSEFEEICEKCGASRQDPVIAEIREWFNGVPVESIGANIVEFFSQTTILRDMKVKEKDPDIEGRALEGNPVGTVLSDFIHGIRYVMAIDEVRYDQIFLTCNNGQLYYEIVA